MRSRSEPGAAQDLRAQNREACHALCARRRGAGARARRWQHRDAARSRRHPRRAPAARAEGITAIAIVFMHAYAYPEHERQAARLAREAGFTQISVSHEVSPLVKFIGRGDTTVADAYLSPLLRRYVDRVARALSPGGACWSRAGRQPAGGRAGRRVSSSCSPRAGSLRPICSKARTRSCPDPRAAWWAQWRRRASPAARRSSASTWAAPPPMSAISTAPMSGPLTAWSPACAYAHR